VELILNDLALEYKVNHLSRVYEIVDRFIELIIALQKNQKDVRLVYYNAINSIELMEGYSFQKLYNDNNIRKDKRSLLLGLFTRLKIVKTNPEEKFAFNGVVSNLCGWAYFNSNILISVTTDQRFDMPFLSGIIIKIPTNEVVELPNISDSSHIDIHKMLLDIRIYEPSPKHKIGKNWGSPMDLDFETAQKVLNEAIMYDNDIKCVVGIYNSNYYTFRRHHDNYYHGYIDNRIPEHIKNKLRKATKI